MYKIYKIVDNTNGNIYVGRTKQTLKQRLSVHKYQNCTSIEIIKNGDYKIELIEETDDKTRERYWIENTDCVNKVIPGRTKKEYEKLEKFKEKKKQWDRKYREKYPEKKKQRDKEYHENNKEKIREKDKENYINNREKKLQQAKEYHKIKSSWQSSMGGRPCRENMSLLKIDPDLFM